jgi:hypothetical protein
VSDLVTVGTTPVLIDVPDGRAVKVIAHGGTIYYSSSSTVTTSTGEALAAETPLTIEESYWFVAASTLKATVGTVAATVVEADYVTTAELTTAIADAVEVTLQNLTDAIATHSAQEWGVHGIAQPDPPTPPAVIPEFGAQVIYGHSYAAYNTADQFHQLVAAELNITTAVNYAIPGSHVSHTNATPAGYTANQGNVFWNIRTLNPATSRQQSAPYTHPRAAAGLAHYFTGINDFVWLVAPTAVELEMTARALRTAIWRERCVAIFEDNHASTGTVKTSWTSNSATTYNSGSTIRGTSSSTAQNQAIAVPADFPGGNIVIGFVGGGSGTVRRGGTFQIYLDGVSQGTIDTRCDGTTFRHNHDVFVIPNVASGAHTIAVDLTALTTDAFFDWWGFDGPDSPTFLVYKQPTLTATGLSNHGGGYTNANITTWNGYIDTIVAASAPGNEIIVVDGHLVGMNATAAEFQADQIHPDASGHIKIADGAIAAMEAAYA